MHLSKRLAAAALIAGGTLVTAQVTEAATLDCSVTAGTCSGGVAIVQGGVTYYQFAGALWTTTDSQSTGTGVIDSFVRISSASDLVVSGMNTDARPLTQDENSSPTFTHDITEGIVPIVTIAGIQYYEFLLDINQTNADPKLSLSGLELCHSGTGSQTIGAGDTDCAGTDIYSLGANNVLLNYGFNSGSGSGDLFVYIPVPVGGIADTNFMYLWSSFGEPPPDGNNDGFEEWAVRTTTPVSAVPEPASLLLFGSGLAGIARAVRRKRSQAAA